MKKVLVYTGIVSQFKMTKAMMDAIALDLHFSIFNLICMMIILIYGIISMIPIRIIHVAAYSVQEAVVMAAFKFGRKED